jgi:hypothetical protein
LKREALPVAVAFSRDAPSASNRAAPAATPSESTLRCAMIYRRPAWRNGRRGGLRQNLSARREIGDAELLKVGETLNLPGEDRGGNPEPSLLTEEGVETRRAAPNPRYPGQGEGIVQTPNLDDSAPRAQIREGGESRRGKKIRCSQGRVGSTPSAGTTVSLFSFCRKTDAAHFRRVRLRVKSPRSWGRGWHRIGSHLSLIECKAAQVSKTNQAHAREGGEPPS